MTTSATNDGKAVWGLSPSIRESILTSQNEIGRKVTSIIRVILVCALVCAIFLGANFALTVTAVVSNKDVYVGDGKRLVTSTGNHLEVDVAEREVDIYDFPYQNIRLFAETRVLIVPSGTDTLVLFPSMFSFRQTEHDGVELQMKSADGTTVTWGPPSPMALNGQLSAPMGSKYITVTKPGGDEVRTPQTDGRRLGGKGGSAITKASSVSGIAEEHCAFTNTWTGEAARVHGYTPTGEAGPFPMSVYLSGTGRAFDDVFGIAFTREMAYRHFASVHIEYTAKWYPPTCWAWHNKAQHISNCINWLCNDNYINCDLGVAVLGWSQGGQEANLVGDWNEKVTASLSFSGTINNSPADRKSAQTTCFANLGLEKDRRRILIGEHDGYMGDQGEADLGSYSRGNPDDVIANALTVSGYAASDCTTTYHCLQADGSGYYVVSFADDLKSVKGPWDCSACHWWFGGDLEDHSDFSGFTTTFKDSNAVWGLNANMNWLANRAKAVRSDAEKTAHHRYYER